MKNNLSRLQLSTLFFSTIKCIIIYIIYNIYFIQCAFLFLKTSYLKRFDDFFNKVKKYVIHNSGTAKGRGGPSGLDPLHRLCHISIYVCLCNMEQNTILWYLSLLGHFTDKNPWSYTELFHLCSFTVNIIVVK